MSGNVQQTAPHAVAAVGDIRKGQRVALVTESPQRKEQVLIAAVAGHDLGRLQAEMRRRRAQQLGTGGVGVKAQLFHLGFAYGCHHPGRRQIGAFVGIQFDVLLILRLLPGRVGGDSGQGRGKKTAHNGFLLLLIPDGHAAGVGVQTLALGKIWQCGAQLLPALRGCSR